MLDFQLTEQWTISYGAQCRVGFVWSHRRPAPCDHCRVVRFAKLTSAYYPVTLGVFHLLSSMLRLHLPKSKYFRSTWLRHLVRTLGHNPRPIGDIFGLGSWASVRGHRVTEAVRFRKRTRSAKFKVAAAREIGLWARRSLDKYYPHRPFSGDDFGYDCRIHAYDELVSFPGKLDITEAT